MSRWTDEDLKELEEADQWDWDSGELRPGVGNRRTTVKVVFAGADFDRLSEAAQQLGVSTIQFIHDAAVARAAQLSQAAGSSRAQN
jgi:hypothetical protein